MQIKLSKCHQRLAFTLEPGDGSERFVGFIRDLSARAAGPGLGPLKEHPALDGVVSLEWAGDGSTLLYTTPNELGRPSRYVDVGGDGLVWIGWVGSFVCLLYVSCLLDFVCLVLFTLLVLASASYGEGQALRDLPRCVDGCGRRSVWAGMVGLVGCSGMWKALGLAGKLDYPPYVTPQRESSIGLLRRVKNG